MKSRATLAATLMTVVALAWLAPILSGLVRAQQDGLVGHWPFDEGAGTNTVDVSGNERAGTLQGNPLPIWASGVSLPAYGGARGGQGSNALGFDGLQNWVEVPHDAGLSPTNALTLATWVKAATNITSEAVAKWTANELGGYMLSLTNGCPSLELTLDGVYTHLVGARGLVDTNWHHLAATYNGAQMVVYLDGETNGSVAATGTIDVVTVPLLVGLLDGVLDDVRIYDRALSASEITDLYNADADGDGVTDGGKVNHSMLGTGVPCPRPSIRSQPVDQTKYQGRSASFSVAASGSSPLSYRWRKNGVNLNNISTVSGATSRKLTLSRVTTNAAGSYSVLISNNCGSVTSASAMLTIIGPPQITSQPMNQTVSAGHTASFSVTASGAVRYQWRKNGRKLSNRGTISGATSTQLVLSIVTPDANGSYDVVVANASGSVASGAATLIVSTASLSITVSPANQTVYAGQPASFTAAASGSPTPMVQWQVSTNGGATFSNISGAMSTTLIVPTGASDNGKEYRAVFSNAYGSLASGAATLIVSDASGCPPPYTANYQTNTISGGTCDLAGDYLVGSNTFADVLRILSNGVLTNWNGYLGYTSSSSNNSVLVTGSGSVWNNSVNLYVGYYGARNSLVISNGGQVASNGASLGGSSNSVLVTGPGSVWSNYYLSVGNPAGAGNSLVISNGGQVVETADYGGGSSVYGSNNSVLVTGPGSVWNSYLYIYGTSNNLVINNGGVARNGAQVNGSSNSVLVTGPGSVLNWGLLDLGSGGGGGNNSLVVSNGGQMINSLAQVNGSSNSVLVTGGGSVWTNQGTLYVGYFFGASNNIVISNGGKVVNGNYYNSDLGGISYVGGMGSLDNSVLVTGSGSVWTNNGAPYIGCYGGAGNSLVISNGGSVVSSDGYVGYDSNSSNNIVRVNGTGSVWMNQGTLYVGYSGSSNLLAIAAAGSVVTTNLFISYSDPGDGSIASNNVVRVDGGSLVVTNADHNGSLVVGQAGGGKAEFILNSGTVTADALIATNVANSFVTLDGGLLTNKVSTTIDNDAVLQFALGTNSHPVVVTSNLTLSGTLNITAPGGIAAGTYTLFKYSGTLTYDGLAIGTTPNPSFTYAIYTSTEGQVNLAVSSGALLPAAAFDGSPTRGVTPLVVTFTDTSSGTITNRFWNFGDGTTTNTTATSLSHTYTGGPYTVSLTVSGPVGSDTMTRTNYIVANTVNLAITTGLPWLVSQQNGDGSWTNEYGEVAYTSFAVVELEERAFELGYASPFDDAYPYKTNVINGLNYLFSRAGTYDGPGTGIYFDEGGYETYNTGIAMMAIAASRAPNRIVDVPGSSVTNMTYKQVLQACVDYFALWQNPDGGWGYSKGSGSDNSNTGFAVLGLRYAEAPMYGFACVIPAALKTGLSAWVDYIQNDVDGDEYDGGSGYSYPNGWVNLLKTGDLLFEMSFVGDCASVQRVQDAIAYIQRHWNDDNEDPGWKPHNYLGMYCLMNGFRSLGIDTITVGGSNVDWSAEFATAILAYQQADGSWPEDTYLDEWGEPMLSSEWALLVLEKATPALFNGLVGWGQNDRGQTTPPAGLTGVVAMAAGYYHTLVLKSDGTVFEWGDNTSPAGLTGVVAIAAGAYHDLALKSDGTVVGWGYNSNGQATPPTNLTGVVAIAAGWLHSLALKSDGTVVTWGYYNAPPTNLTGVVAIAGGGYHSLALKSDGTVVGWAGNGYGNSSGQAIPPTNLTGVVAIAGGGFHSLALKGDGTVVAWGDNTLSQTNTPTGLGNVVAIAAGGYHNLALKSDGTVVCWAYNGYGQSTPPAGLTRVVAIAAGWEHSLALASPCFISPPSALTATVVSSSQINLLWTDNSSNEDGFKIERAPDSSGVPGAWTQIATVATNVTTYSDVGLAGSTKYWYRVRAYNAVVDSDYSNQAEAMPCLRLVVGWGQNDRGQTTPPAGLTGVVAMAAGYYHTLVLKSDGTIFEWGDNTSPAGLTGVVAIAAGAYHDLAVKSNGTVVGWGAYAYGAETTPTNLTGVVAVAAGSWHSVALKKNGTVVAWGNSQFGQTGVPTNLTGVVAISASGFHSLALKSDGTVVGWGRNDYGQATPPAGLTGVVAISAGEFHSLALKSDGTVVGWGNNVLGSTNSPTGLGNVVAIAAGGYHNLALKSDGTVVCWAYNGYGQSTPPAGLNGVVAIAAGWEHSLALASSCFIGPPSTLTATAVSSNQINLSWTDNSSNVDGFKIERAPDSSGVPGAWTQIATVGANVTTYSDLGLAAGTKYWYRVRAYNVSGNSNYSYQVRAVT